MKHVILTVLILLFASAVYAGECEMLGDHAVMFAQFKAAGYSLAYTQKYIDDNYSKGSHHQLFKALADDIYAAKRDLSARQWRILVEDKCKDTKGIR